MNISPSIIPRTSNIYTSVLGGGVIVPRSPSTYNGLRYNSNLFRILIGIILILAMFLLYSIIDIVPRINMEHSMTSSTTTSMLRTESSVSKFQNNDKYTILHQRNMIDDNINEEYDIVPKDMKNKRSKHKKLSQIINHKRSSIIVSKRNTVSPTATIIPLGSYSSTPTPSCTPSPSSTSSPLPSSSSLPILPSSTTTISLPISSSLSPSSITTTSSSNIPVDFLNPSSIQLYGTNFYHSIRARYLYSPIPITKDYFPYSLYNNMPKSYIDTINANSVSNSNTGEVSKDQVAITNSLYLQYTILQEQIKKLFLRLDPQSSFSITNLLSNEWSPDLTTPIRSATDVQDRLLWFKECLQISRKRTHGYTAGYGPSQGIETRPIEELETNYYVLKYSSFKLFEGLQHLWDTSNPNAPFQADWGFYKGPWIEDYWRYTFGRPIRRNISIVEWQYQVKRMGKESIKALSMPWDMIEVELVRSLSLPLQNEYLVLEEEFHKRVQGNDYNARQYVMDESLRKGLPFVEVEELFDYDLFYPYVPLFVPWERMAYSLFYGGTIAGKDANDDGRTLERMKSIQREMEHFLISKYNSAITYITVVQRAEGILMDNSRVLLPFLANMVTLNAGGGGDIPIPLLSGEQQLEDNIPAFGQHLHWISFVGAIREGIRSEIVQLTNYCYGQKLDKEFSKFRHRYFNIIKSDKFGEYTILEPNDYPERNYSSTSRSKEMRFRTPWIEMMSYSMLQLAPRGTNPTSFRCMKLYKWA